MATTFSFREGASLPTDLGQALSEQIARLFRREAQVVPVADHFAGPSFSDLEPGLAGETARG